jgi:hypothetical protein
VNDLTITPKEEIMKSLKGRSVVITILIFCVLSLMPILSGGFMGTTSKPLKVVKTVEVVEAVEQEVKMLDIRDLKEVPKIYLLIKF